MACHTGEANTVFTHIKPAPFGTEAGLSGFMKGITPGTVVMPFKVVDPADGLPLKRKFNEFRRRRIDLDIPVHSSCVFDFQTPLPPVDTLIDGATCTTLVTAGHDAPAVAHQTGDG